MNQVQVRPLYEIAQEIASDWHNVYFGARPYLAAMAQLRSIDDHYGFDGARGIVSYFLSNARGWRGETARRVKAELQALVADRRAA
jgi:hypothetical protein